MVHSMFASFCFNLLLEALKKSATYRKLFQILEINVERRYGTVGQDTQRHLHQGIPARPDAASRRPSRGTIR
jgi:hypothetical protein